MFSLDFHPSIVAVDVALKFIDLLPIGWNLELLTLRCDRLVVGRGTCDMIPRLKKERSAEEVPDMASGISGGNYFSNINQQLAKGPDMKTAESLRQTGGTANLQRKGSKTVKKDEDGGVQLSDAAQKSLHASHLEHIEGHEAELAHQAGLQETEDNAESQDLKMKRGYERDQEEKAEASAAGYGQVPEGYGVVRGVNGVEQVVASDQIEELKALDNDLEHVENRVLGDIPQQSLEAAERVLDTQMKDGLKKVANLKPVPEAQDAGRMELSAVDFLVEPLEIRETGNDRSLPMTLDFPDSMMEVAREKAADALASGQSSQEEMLNP